MGDPLSMTMANSFQNFVHNFLDLFLSQSSVLLHSSCQNLKEVFSLAILHNQIDIVLILIGFIVLHYVGRIQFLQIDYFSFEGLNNFSQFWLAKNFHGHLLTRIIYVLGEEYFAEVAYSKNCVAELVFL